MLGLFQLLRLAVHNVQRFLERHEDTEHLPSIMRPVSIDHAGALCRLESILPAHDRILQLYSYHGSRKTHQRVLSAFVLQLSIGNHGNASNDNHYAENDHHNMEHERLFHTAL